MGFVPLWAGFGLGAAFLSAAMMLMQEHLRVNGYAMAFWNKAACVLVTLPFVLLHGAPADMRFYFYLAATAALYAVSDVLFFSAIPKTSAGAVARLIPSASVLGFLLWFVIDPALLARYAEAPVMAGLIFAVLCLFALFAFRLKKCTVTMATLRAIWYVIFAATVGPLITKMTTFYAERDQAIFGYVFFQGVMMMACWLGYLALRRPIPVREFFAPHNARPGLLIGFISAGAVLLKFAAFYYVDNPAYIPAIVALDSVLILFFYKLRGIRAEGDIVAGLGLVACAVALIVLKANIP